MAIKAIWDKEHLAKYLAPRLRSHLAQAAYRECVASMARGIEEEAAAIRKRTGSTPLGVAAVLAQNPASRPEHIKRSPAPLLHAASRTMRQLYYEGFAAFVSAYRAAAEKLRSGDLAPPFPIGSFPPALPFVGG